MKKANAKKRNRTVWDVVSEILSDERQHGTITVYAGTSGRGIYEPVASIGYSGGEVSEGTLPEHVKATEAGKAVGSGTYPAMDYSVVLKK